jgi:hypothetical protein
VFDEMLQSSSFPDARARLLLILQFMVLHTVKTHYYPPSPPSAVKLVFLTELVSALDAITDDYRCLRVV